MNFIDGHLRKRDEHERRRGRIKRGAFEEMARLAAHQGRESYSHDGVRAAARPFVSFQGGAGGNRNPPAFLFREAGGDILFSKENIPIGFCREPQPLVGAKKK